MVGQIGFVELLVLTRQERLPGHPDSQGEEDQRRKKQLLGTREKISSFASKTFLESHSTTPLSVFLIGSFRARSAGKPDWVAPKVWNFEEK